MCRPSRPVVAAIGLGPMGFAVAAALRAGASRLVVWNRSPGPMERFRGEVDVTLAASMTQAMEDADFVVVCVKDYEVTRALLAGCQPDRMRGRTLVQLSTGTPTEAREMGGWARLHGIDFIDGSILSYPYEIGTDDALIFYAGDTPVYERARPLLEALGPASFYCGPDLGAAPAQFHASLAMVYGASFGLVQGAALAAAEGIPIEKFVAWNEPQARLLPKLVKFVAAAIAEPSEPAEVNSATNLRALDLLVDTAEEAGLTTELPEAMRKLMAAAVEVDNGRESMAVLYELIRLGPGDRDGGHWQEA